MTRLFIGNLAWALDETGLAAEIAALGISVTNPKILRDRETGRPRGFGFVEVADTAAATAVVAALDGARLAGRPVRVEIAQAREPLPPRRAAAAPPAAPPLGRRDAQDDRPRRGGRGDRRSRRDGDDWG